MVWFQKGKRKAKRVITDWERELALQTRLENKQLRDAEREKKLLQIELEKAEIQAELNELIPEDTGLFGIGQEEMMLLNIITQGKFNTQGLGANIEPTTPTENTPSIETSSVLSSLPKFIPRESILNILKNTPKEELVKAIDTLQEQNSSVAQNSSEK